MSTGVFGYEVFITEPIPLDVPDGVPDGGLRTFSPELTTLVHGEPHAAAVPAGAAAARTAPSRSGVS